MRVCVWVRVGAPHSPSHSMWKLREMISSISQLPTNGLKFSPINPSCLVLLKIIVLKTVVKLSLTRLERK